MKLYALNKDSVVIDVEGNGCSCVTTLPPPQILKSETFSCKFFQESYSSSHQVLFKLSHIKITSETNSQVEKILVVPHDPEEKCFEATKTAKQTWNASIWKGPCWHRESGRASSNYRYNYPNYKLIINLSPPNKTVESTLLQDLKSLLQEGMLADVEFEVQGEILKAHTAVLAARSPVMAAMFVHDFKERALKVVTIEDACPGVFRQFLAYLYTDTAPPIWTEGMAEGLFTLADKYDVATLKTLALSHIIKQLRVDNVLSSLALSYLHSSERLRDNCFKLIAGNCSKIFASPEWVDLSQNCPQLFVEATEFFASKYHSIRSVLNKKKDR